MILYTIAIAKYFHYIFNVHAYFYNFLKLSKWLDCIHIYFTLIKLQCFNMFVFDNRYLLI